MDGENWVASIKEEIAETKPTPDPAPASARTRIDAPKLVHVGRGVTRHNGGSIKKVRIGLHKYSDWRGEDMYTVKRNILVSLLRRRQEKSLDEYVTVMRKMVERALECYEGPTDFDGSPNHEQFAQMMLFDSCFIVELLRIMANLKDADESDHPFHNLLGDLNNVKRDLICIENQLPLFVLQEFFEMSEHETDQHHNLNALVERFSKAMLRAFIPSTPSSPNGSVLQKILKLITCDHHRKNYSSDHPTEINSLLGEMHNILPKNLDFAFGWFFGEKLAKYVIELKEEAGMGERDFIKCATELEEEAGIGFKKAPKHEENILKIDFKNGEMLIPPFKFTRTTEHLLKNLMEYEKQYPIDFPRFVGEYIKFMKRILNSEKDVQLLCRRGIIANWTDNNQHVISAFTDLSREAEISYETPYRDVISKVNEYCSHRRNIWMAMFWRDYSTAHGHSFHFLPLLFCFYSP